MVALFFLLFMVVKNVHSHAAFHYVMQNNMHIAYLQTFALTLILRERYEHVG